MTVAKALVTQASAAIPIVPLYMAALYKVMKIKGTHEGCIEQIDRLFRDFLYNGTDDILLDSEGRIRTDEREMDPNTQETALKLFADVETDTLQEDLNISDYQAEFYKLFGFGVEGVAYDDEVEIVVPVPSIIED